MSTNLARRRLGALPTSVPSVVGSPGGCFTGGGSVVGGGGGCPSPSWPLVAVGGGGVVGGGGGCLLAAVGTGTLGGGGGCSLGAVDCWGALGGTITGASCNWGSNAWPGRVASPPACSSVGLRVGLTTPPVADRMYSEAIVVIAAGVIGGDVLGGGGGCLAAAVGTGALCTGGGCFIVMGGGGAVGALGWAFMRSGARWTANGWLGRASSAPGGRLLGFGSGL